jgi:hypothetical protein
MKWNSLDDYLIDKENKNRFHELIRKMPIFYVDVFCQYFLGDKKLKDIAKEYGRSITWISIVRHRAYNFISVYMNNDKDITNIKLSDYYNKKTKSFKGYRHHLSWQNFNPYKFPKLYKKKQKWEVRYEVE